MIARPRWLKKVISASADLVLLLLSFGFAMALRIDSLEFFGQMRGVEAILIVAPLTVLALRFSGTYRVVVRYVTASGFKALFLILLLSAVALFFVSQIFELGVPRSVPPIYAMLAIVSLVGTRLVIRETFNNQQMRGRIPVLIYGAGSSGRQLLKALENGAEYLPVAFIDDAPQVQKTVVSGKRVYGPDRVPRLISDTGTRLMLLALPSATRTRRNAIISQLSALSMQVRTIPGMSDIISGQAQITDVRDVPLDDLLGRDPVAPDEALMRAKIKDRTVMVTGAGGSIGSELCRQILQQVPKKLVLLDISEPSLYALEVELRILSATLGVQSEIIPLLGSVGNETRIRSIFDHHHVETIFHAAAYKHVPLVEQNSVEGVRNNVFGTHTLLKAAVKASVATFILVSTDKAVRPTNVMGATKRLAELVCQAEASTHPKTCIAMVRFGNVLGSSGSVIPRFKAQIAEGGPLTVTHPEITRYFMSIPEAAQLVIQAGSLASGGDVFVLDMGSPIRIVDLADRMARLSGLTPYYPGTERPAGGDIEICFTALRPGEKLYEELLIDDEARPTTHSRVLTASETFLALPALEALLEQLREACASEDVEAIRSLLKSAPAGYQPSKEIADLLWVSG
jgi:FlaA1/EpsC-like NDP-sugar epimerase